MGREGHRRGEESDALAALSRALRAGSDTATAAATPPVAPAEGKAAGTGTKDGKAKKGSSEKKQKKHKHQEAAVAAAADPDGPGPATQPREPAPAESCIELALQGLRRATVALQEAAVQAAGSPPSVAMLQQQLESLAAAAEQLCTALAGTGAAQPPAALQLLRSQARLLLHSCQASGGSMTALPPSASQLAALHLQAAAAAAAVGQQGQAQPAGLPADSPAQRLRFQHHFMAAFADCYAAEVEALQEAEPPIPAGVLLQCVRMAADSEALHPPCLRAVVLDAAAACPP